MKRIKFQSWAGSVKKYCDCGKGNICIVAVNGKWMCLDCYEKTIEETVQHADAIVILTEWNQYRGLNLVEIKKIMRGNVFIDLRNVYERDGVEACGFRYTCVGR